MSRLIYPSTNEFGVPDLAPEPSLQFQPGVPDLAVVWGSVARTRIMSGLWLFYCDDRRFARVWNEPEQVERTACRAVVEPNYSTTETTSRAEALWNIYRKRWLARRWQEAGITVWADLYVADRHHDIALLGVPVGWQRYAIHAADRALGDAELALELATSHSQGRPFSLLAYGGGRETAAWARARANVVHVPSRTAGTLKLGEGTRRARDRRERSDAAPLGGAL